MRDQNPDKTKLFAGQIVLSLVIGTVFGLILAVPLWLYSFNIAGCIVWPIAVAVATGISLAIQGCISGWMPN